MKSKAIYTFLGGLFIALTAFGGGKSSNGNGGLKKETGFTPLGFLGQLIASAKESPLAEQAARWAEERGEALETCPKSSRQYMKLPTELAESLQLRIEVEDKTSFEHKGAGARALLGIRKTRFVALTPDSLCRARLSAFEAYLSLVMAAFPNGKTMDEIVSMLLDESDAKTSPVQIILREKSRRAEARGPNIEESTWFDHESGELHWARPKPIEGIFLFTQRSSSALLRHELAHVFIRQKLGSAYPSNEKHWHDTRYLKEMHDGVLGDAARTAFKFETSEAAAFIEGFAYAMEGPGRGSEHLWIDHMGNIFKMYRGCYFYQDLSWVKDGGARFEAPLKSEVYVGSTLSDLATYTYEEVKENGEPTIYTGTNIEALKNLIRAMSNSPTLSIVELAKSYDEVSGQTDGWSWAREFYFTDYRSGENTRAEFKISKRDTSNDFFFTKPYDICVTDTENKNFFSNLQDERESALRAKSKEALLTRTDFEKLRAEIPTLLENAVKTRAEIAEKLMSVEAALNFMSAFQKDVPYNLRNSNVLSDVLIKTKIDREIYRELESKRIFTDLVTVMVFMERAVNTFEHEKERPQLTILQDSIDKTIATFQALAQLPGDMDLRTKNEAVDNFRNSKGSLESLLQQLRVELALVKQLQTNQADYLQRLKKETEKVLK